MRDCKTIFREDSIQKLANKTNNYNYPNLRKPKVKSNKMKKSTKALSKIQILCKLKGIFHWKNSLTKLQK